MGFDINHKKPKLVEPQLFKYYNDKHKIKDLKRKIKQDEILEQTKLASKTWFNKAFQQSWGFIKENYGFFLISALICILLYVRYVEVKKRKNKMKNIIDKINQEKEEQEAQQLIELQQLNE